MINYDSARLSIAVVCCFYNDLPGIKRQLETTAGKFNYCFMLDGRFKYLKDKDYYFEHPLSTDGSRELVETCYRQNVYLIDEPDLTESAKRMRAIEIAQQYGVDCILTLDSDEYVEYLYPDLFRNDAYEKMVIRDKGLWNIYNVDCRDRRQYQPRPRLWFKPWEISYGTTHYEFYKRSDVTQELISMGGDEFHLVKHIQVRHDQNIRHFEHRHAQERWEYAQQAVEDVPRFGKDFEGLKVVRHANEEYIPTKKV